MGSKSSVKSICELHFSDEDMRSHGTTKRLVAGAVPLIPNTQDELLDERSENQQLEDLWEEDDELDSSDEEEDLIETDSPDVMNSQTLSVGSSYKPSSSQSASTENDSDTIDPQQSADDFKLPFMFVIVMWSQIFKLLSKCQRQGCGSSVLVDNMKFVTNGAAVKVYSTCNNGHNEKWSSSASIVGAQSTVPLINIYIICFSLFSGLQ